MRRYFSAHNYYASTTDVGFANMWYVLVWESRKARDEHLKTRNDLASHAIPKSEIGKYVEHPAPFSGERWVLHDTDPSASDYPGCLGKVIVGRVDAVTRPINR